jgi:hypothetical protein
VKNIIDIKRVCESNDLTAMGGVVKGTEWGVGRSQLYITFRFGHLVCQFLVAILSLYRFSKYCFPL